LHCADSEIVSTLTPQAQSAAKSAMMAASLAAIQAKSPEAQEREAKKMQAKLNSLPKAESNATETTVSDNPAIDVTALVNQLDPLTNAAAPPLSTQWQRVYHFRSDSQLENSFNNPRHCQLPCVGVPELVEVRRLRGPNTPTLFAHEPRDVSAVENTEKVSSVTINDVSTTAETTVSMESVMPRLQRAKSHTIAPVLRRADLASGSVSFELSSDTSIPLANASPVSPDIEEQDLEDDEFDAQSAQTIALELVARPINDDSDDD
jgi:hypothetical protein